MNNNDTFNSMQEEKNNGLSSLIVNLQKEDARNLGIYKKFQVIYLVFAIFYVFVFILNPFWDLGLLDRLSGGCYVLAFLILFFVFRKYNHEFRNIDYAVPTAVMLKEASRRYAFVKARRIAVLIIPLILVDAAISMTMYQRFFESDRWKAIAITQAVYIPFIMLGFIIGIIIWRIKQKPLKDEALRLLTELER